MQVLTKQSPTWYYLQHHSVFHAEAVLPVAPGLNPVNDHHPLAVAAFLPGPVEDNEREPDPFGREAEPAIIQAIDADLEGPRRELRFGWHGHLDGDNPEMEGQEIEEIGRPMHTFKGSI